LTSAEGNTALQQAEEPWYKKPETGDMVSLRHHDDGRPIEVVDTLFTEDLVKEVLSGKARDLENHDGAMVVVGQLHGVSYRAAVTDHTLVSC